MTPLRTPGPPLPQCVVVNLRFDCAETRRLGVEGHVCELQLALRAFVRPKKVRSSPPQLACRYQGTTEQASTKA